MDIRLSQAPESSDKIDYSESADLPVEQQPPKFSFRFLTKSHCITHCDKNEKVGFVDKMHQISQCSWATLKLMPKHSLGYEVIKKEKLKVPIPKNISQEVRIIAFRFKDKKPMVGYREKDGTFYVLWFDRNFNVYPHGK